jgi:hypothetical protein
MPVPPEYGQENAKSQKDHQRRIPEAAERHPSRP